MFLEDKAKYVGAQEAKPFTLPHLIAWLEVKNPAERYETGCVSACMICQYGKENGVQPTIAGTYFNKTLRALSGLPLATIIEHIAYGGLCAGERSTFGAALTRARALSQDIPHG